jgi:hypothetical protein
VAIAQADTAGTFDLTGLPVDGARRWLFALYDRDANRSILRDGEFTSPPDSVILTPESPIEGRVLRLVDPRAPGTVQGGFTRAAGDTVRLAVEVYDASADSAAAPRFRSWVGEAGGFSLTPVPPGTYRVQAFCDLNGNGARDPGEPVSIFGTIEVEPGGKHELGSWAGPDCTP